MKQFFYIFMVVVFVVMMAGCSGKGEIMELSPKEMKEFMGSNGTGFVMLDYDEDDRDFWMNSVKNVIQEQKINVRELEEKKIAAANDGRSNPQDFGLTQRRDSLAYYQEGELKEDIKFEEYKPSELEGELEFFVKRMKETYIDN